MMSFDSIATINNPIQLNSKPQINPIATFQSHFIATARDYYSQHYVNYLYFNKVFTIITIISVSYCDTNAIVVIVDVNYSLR